MYCLPAKTTNYFYFSDSGTDCKRHSLESKCSTPDEEDIRALPSHPHKLKRKKSFSGIISKIMTQNRTAKLWKEEAAATMTKFKNGRPKFLKSISLPNDRKGFLESRSLSADQGYESSDAIAAAYLHDSSEEDDAISECNYCGLSERRRFRRSMSAPGVGSQDLLDSRQKMACRHWQWFLRSSSSTWQSFNTHKVFCY